MLESTKIQKRQSEIRQELATLSAKSTPTEDETRSMQTLDTEYQTNETRYRAALTSEDTERRAAGEELETRSDREWSDMVDNFEMRQVALALDEGRTLDGQTNEIVTEMRSNGGYRGVPVPWQALEIRAGETTSSDTPNPVMTRPLIERLFPQSVAARMGGQMINVGVGEVETPVTTSAVTASWAATEGGDVAGPQKYTTLDRPMKPDNTLGIQMRLTRKSLKQSGAPLEQSIRRDMNGAMEQEMDRAVFQGSGSGGEPTGIFAGASAWGIEEVALGFEPTWKHFREQVVEFITGNAATGPGDVRAMIRPEVWSKLDDTISFEGTGVTEWDRLTKALQSVTMTHNALAAPVGDPAATTSVLTTTAGGVAPYFVGTWGGVDLIRDPYADAQSGGLRLTALVTMDVTISRKSQTRLITDIR